MRVDGVVWQKSKISSVSGFLSNEGDFLIYTKYKKGYDENSFGLHTKQEIATNRIIDSIMGMLRPEKELFRINKKDITDLNVTKLDPVTTGGKTYYSAYATFRANGVDYSMTHASGSAEKADQLGAMFANA